MLRHHIANLLAVPLSDPVLTRQLSELGLARCIDGFGEWLTDVRNDNPTFGSFTLTASNRASLLLSIPSFADATVSIEFLTGREIPLKPKLSDSPRPDEQIDLRVLVLCIEESSSDAQVKTSEFLNVLAAECPEALVLEPRWSAAIIVERARPILSIASGAGAPPTTYFEGPSSPRTDAPVSLLRYTSGLQPLLAKVLDEPGSYAAKIEQLIDAEPFNGTILLCSTFLPPVTHSISAAIRFYRDYGVRPETIRLIQDRYIREEKAWANHTRAFQRVDIFDRAQLEEYFADPEYYQMRLRPDELREQQDHFLRMLECDNYSACLTPEAVNLSYDIRGDEVRVRTDRRNKGQARLGRVTGIRLHDQRIAQLFEREFWSMYQQTESEFKNKKEIANWVRDKVASYRYTLPKRPARNAAYDVFVCYNRADWGEVEVVVRQLKKRKIKPWVDKWESQPGRPWTRSLEAEIELVNTAAVFVGASGFGPWQLNEMDAFIREFVKRECRVIPVILGSAKHVPPLPIFLSGMEYIDLRDTGSNPMDRLVFGITGRRKRRSSERRG